MGPHVFTWWETIISHSHFGSLIDFQSFQNMVSKKNKQNKASRKREALLREMQSVGMLSGKGNYYSQTVAPAMRNLVPAGTFSNLGSKFGRAVGSVGGSSLGPAGMTMGSTFGSRLGANLGQRLAKLVGFGDYEVETNSLLKTGGVIPPGEAIPSFGVMGASTRVRHREYLGDITVPGTPTAFTLSSYTVNPGDPVTFPWLNTIASQYQQYRFDGLIFEFKTLSSDITSGGALGAVILASNYDVVQNSFTDKISMENSQYAVSTKPSCSIIHTMECAPGQVANNLYYVQAGLAGIATGSDNRFYDLANFQIATQGLPGSVGQVLGELWVSYDVQLFKPIINEQVNGALITGVDTSSTSTFGSFPTIAGTIVNASSNFITFNVTGQYLVSLLALGTGMTGGFTLSGNPGRMSQQASIYPATGLSASVWVAVDITNPGQTLFLTPSGFTGLTSSQCFVAPWSYNFV
jgi:hypothetical protein